MVIKRKPLPRGDASAVFMPKGLYARPGFPNEEFVKMFFGIAKTANIENYERC